MLAPSPPTTKVVVLLSGVETSLEVGSWVAKDSVISFRLPFGSQRRLADALGGEREYASVSFTLRSEGIEYSGCRVDAWYRNGMVVVQAPGA
jgi:hypothetical protein